MSNSFFDSGKRGGKFCHAFCLFMRIFSPFLYKGKIEKDTEILRQRLDKINFVCYNKIRENTWASRGLADAFFQKTEKDGCAAKKRTEKE